MTFGEEQTESDSPYTVVLPYTGISRDIKGHYCLSLSGRVFFTVTHRSLYHVNNNNINL